MGKRRSAERVNAGGKLGVYIVLRAEKWDKRSNDKCL